MADSSAVDAALLSKLQNDATLMALMTDGVYFDEAPQGATKFVIVQQMNHDDTYVQGAATSALEEAVYLVKAVALDTSGADVKTAAARIDTLLHGGTITPTGYSLMNLRRWTGGNNRVRMTEDDDQNDQRWQHRGFLYEVMVQ